MIDRAPLHALIAVMSTGRFNYSEEVPCQHEIAEFLTGMGIPFEREFRLTDGIVDFFFPRSGLGMEVKAGKRWSKREVYRQCERYCQDERITGLLLATGKSQGLPAQINGKAVAVHSLGLSHL